MALVKHTHNQTQLIHDDPWHVLHTPDLPEPLTGSSLPMVHLVELIHKNQRPDIIIPLTAVLSDMGLAKETVALIATHSSRMGVWLDAGFAAKHSMEDLDKLLAFAHDKDNRFGLDLLLFYVPAFADGRHFSLVQYVRQQGYDGEVRLAGDFGIDQLAYAQRMGVDSYLTQERMSNADTDAASLTHLNTTFEHLPSAYEGRNVNRLPMFADLTTP